MQINVIFSFAYLHKYTRNESIRRRLCRQKSMQIILGKLRCRNGRCDPTTPHCFGFAYIACHHLHRHWQISRNQLKRSEIIGFSIRFFLFPSSSGWMECICVQCKCIQCGELIVSGLPIGDKSWKISSDAQSCHSIWIRLARAHRRHYSKDLRMQTYLCSKTEFSGPWACGACVLSFRKYLRCDE